MRETAELLSVEQYPEASALVGDHSASDTTIAVASGRVFGDSGACRIEAVDYTYTREGDVLTITPGLTTSALDGETVYRLNAWGDVEGRLVANVDFDGDGGADDEAEIRTSDRAYFPEGDAAAGTIVDVQSTTYGYEISSRPLDPAVLDPAFVPTPILDPILTANLEDVSPNADVTVTGMVQHGVEHGIPGRPDVDGWVTLPGPGVYHLTGTVSWSASSDGARHAVLQMRDDSAMTTSVLRRVSIRAAADLTDTVVQVIATRTFTTPTSIRLRGQQTTGLLLDMQGFPNGRGTALDIVRLSPARVRTAAHVRPQRRGGPGGPTV